LEFILSYKQVNIVVFSGHWKCSCLNRAAAYLEMGELDSCIEDCQKAVDWNKEYNLRTDYKIIARAYARMGKLFFFIVLVNDQDNGLLVF